MQSVTSSFMRQSGSTRKAISAFRGAELAFDGTCSYWTLAIRPVGAAGDDPLDAN